MARPPARAGGRSDSLTVGESRKLKGCVSKKTKTKKLIVFSRLFPKGTHPRPQPAQLVGGPLRAFAGRAAGQVFRKKYSLPPHPPEGSPEGRTSSLWGSFPHFFPRNGAPAGQATVPRRSNGAGEKPQRPRPPHAKTPSLWPKNSHSAHGSYQVSYSLTAKTDKNLSFPIKLLSSACQ